MRNILLLDTTIYWRLYLNPMIKRARYKLHKFFPELSSNCNYMSDESVKAVYYGLIKMIGSSLLKKGKLKCPDLGEFYLLIRAPHYAMDVKSHQMKLLPEKKIVKFKPCRKMKAYFKDIILEGEDSPMI